MEKMERWEYLEELAEKNSKSVEGNIKDTVYSSCVTYFHMYYL